MPKIVQYKLPPGGTVVELADNTSEALDIETINADGSTGDYITINTTDSGETMQLQAGAGPGLLFETSRVRSGAGGQVGLQLEDPTATNPVLLPSYQDADTGIGRAADDALSLIAGGVEAIRCVEDGGAAVIQFGQDNYDPQIEQSSGASFGYTFKGDTNTGMTSGGESDTLYLTAGNTQAIYIAESGAIATTRIDGPTKVLGAFATQGSGTVGTGGSSSTTLEQTGASTFQTELHVGAAIKIISGGVIKKATVASITDANTLELDSAETIADGSNWYYDSGELFAVKTGDSKTLLGVNGSGAMTLGTNPGDATQNIAIGDSDALDTITTGESNIIIGTSADNYKLTSGGKNVFIGHKAGEDTDGGQNSVLIGFESGMVVNASSNAYVGTYSGKNATGGSNVAMGKNALRDNTGSYNVAIGEQALDKASAALYTTAVGYKSLTNFDSGALESNSALGYQSGDNLQSGQQCLFLGAEADTTDTDGNNQIAIGYGAVCDAPNKIMLGNHRNVDMTLDCPPITVKQTATDGSGISIEHEGSSNAIVEIGEVDDAGRIELKKGSDGTVTHRFRFGSSSWINNNTTYMLGVSTNNPNSNFHSGGTNAYAVTAGGSLITSSHTVGTHSTMLYNASGGDITATLPAASGVAGRVYTFKLVTKGGNDLIIASNGSETIEGSTSNFTVDTEKEAVTIQSDGVGWQVIGKYLT
jgi:hypothetical protein